MVYQIALVVDIDVDIILILMMQMQVDSWNHYAFYSSDRFGWSISLSSDGNTTISGAMHASNNLSNLRVKFEKHQYLS